MGSIVDRRHFESHRPHATRQRQTRARKCPIALRLCKANPAAGLMIGESREHMEVMIVYGNSDDLNPALVQGLREDSTRDFPGFGRKPDGVPLQKRAGPQVELVERTRCRRVLVVTLAIPTMVPGTPSSWVARGAMSRRYSRCSATNCSTARSCIECNKEESPGTRVPGLSLSRQVHRSFNQ